MSYTYESVNGVRIDESQNVHRDNGSPRLAARLTSGQ